MKKYKRFILFGGMTLLFAAGCSDIQTKATGNKEKEIAVEKRVEAEDIVEPFKEINVTDERVIQKAENILADVKWENAEVRMAAPIYAKFHLAKSKQAGSEEIIYYLWISPGKDQVELVVEGEGKYAQFSKSKSAELFKTITGGNLPGA